MSPQLEFLLCRLRPLLQFKANLLPYPVFICGLFDLLLLEDGLWLRLRCRRVFDPGCFRRTSNVGLASDFAVRSVPSLRNCICGLFRRYLRHFK